MPTTKRTTAAKPKVIPKFLVLDSGCDSIEQGFVRDATLYKTIEEARRAVGEDFEDNDTATFFIVEVHEIGQTAEIAFKPFTGKK